MTCCAPTIVPFYNVESSTVEYSIAMRNQHGSVPKVEVLYYDDTNDEYYLSSNQTRVTINGNPATSVTVDHGGPSTGVIRIV